MKIHMGSMSKRLTVLLPAQFVWAVMSKAICDAVGDLVIQRARVFCFYNIIDYNA